MPLSVILNTELPGLTPAASGKVRDIHALSGTMLIVATDRISVFDVIINGGAIT